ncbi:MAG: hypothetical protein R2850_02545 [Bacteroidia bacterium]
MKKDKSRFFNDRLFVLPGSTHLFDHPLSGPSGQFMKQKLEDLYLSYDASSK